MAFHGRCRHGGRSRGARAAPPLDATSHWLDGDAAGLFAGADGRRPGVGYATNHAACLLWALPFTAWQRFRPAETPVAPMRDAFVMSAIAAAVDDRIPKRSTPGWELVLSGADMAGIYAALTIGFAVGASLDRRR